MCAVCTYIVIDPYTIMSRKPWILYFNSALKGKIHLALPLVPLRLQPYTPTPLPTKWVLKTAYDQAEKNIIKTFGRLSFFNLEK